MTDNNRLYVENKMRRSLGMSPEKVEAMHAANEHELWWVRCWHCGKQTTAIRSELKTCEHCGVNLWSCDAAS